MPSLFWLVFKKNTDTILVIEPGGTMDFAQLKASIALGDAKYQEGYELTPTMARKVPKKLIGMPLDQKQANALVKKLR